MFLCETCFTARMDDGGRNGFPFLAASRGPCEDCGARSDCADPPSSFLPIPSPVLRAKLQALARPAMTFEPEPLGNGYTVSFQKNAKGEVRAIVKDASGVVIIRGPVVPQSEAARSKREAVMEFMTTVVKPPKPETPLAEEEDEDEEDEDGEDYEEEDDEDDEH